MKGRRRHAEVWPSLAAELKLRGVPHSNARVARYGPDLFTYKAPECLFEIKSHVGAQDVFTAAGQLHVYERLLGQSFRKVLVVPRGMATLLQGAVTDLGLEIIEYDRPGRKVSFNPQQLGACLKESKATSA